MLMRRLIIVAAIGAASIGVAAADENEPLKELDTGAYAEVAKRPNPRRLILQHVPALTALLLAAERKKGTALTKTEVEFLRDIGTVMVVDSEGARAVEAQRGYKDIDPAQVWVEWQSLRSQLK